MAGPQDIQRFPRGLIDILGMRATGETPSRLAQETQPQLDLIDLYLLDRQRQFQNSSAVIAANGNVLIPGMTVPSGELWFLYEATMQVPTIAVATLLQTMLAVYRSQTGTNLPLGLGPSIRTPALEGNAWGIHFEKPLIMSPAQSIGLYTSVCTGAPGVAVQVTINYSVIAS
jgi:hypothetical protein